MFEAPRADGDVEHRRVPGEDERDGSRYGTLEKALLQIRAGTRTRLSEENPAAVVRDGVEGSGGLSVARLP